MRWGEMGEISHVATGTPTMKGGGKRKVGPLISRALLLGGGEGEEGGQRKGGRRRAGGEGQGCDWVAPGWRFLYPRPHLWRPFPLPPLSAPAKNYGGWWQVGRSALAISPYHCSPGPFHTVCPAPFVLFHEGGGVHITRPCCGRSLWAWGAQV